ncbi:MULTISPECIES: T9SS type A sorting domain-containing protein [Mesoflavibacter]|uniref:T9SS type A sorting domain-containing protein n=1 Tax=Mesoflavibacter TaxID=444051 RepID=UPI000D0ED017|nr:MULTISPECIES: T9SS type A sorting domain-containing protein [Mesoflavibacter]QIJ88688.1 hypothetical protein C7H62_0879 [Mesoflavibacter sp. HG96]QIJ91416.1 hypothetical protein C7H56_0879 [Mesoflavibacter sp. HG37]
MKQTLLFLALVATNFLFAQNIDYSLEWNNSTMEYEIYITRDIAPTPPVTNTGTSKFTIVAPTNTSRTLTLTSQTIGSYTQSNKITSPAAQPESDFFTFSDVGGNSMIGVVQPGVPTLWLTFTASDGGCVDGLRLFENGVDPDSSAAGMNGSDRTQSFTVIIIPPGSSFDEYSSNTGGNPTCPTLGVEGFNLLEFSMYPNPTTNYVNLSFSNASKNIDIAVYDVLGKQVFSKQKAELIDSSFTLDVSNYNNGLYFVKINSEGKTITKKLIKK